MITYLVSKYAKVFRSFCYIKCLNPFVKPNGNCTDLAIWSHCLVCAYLLSCTVWPSLHRTFADYERLTPNSIERGLRLNWGPSVSCKTKHSGWKCSPMYDAILQQLLLWVHTYRSPGMPVCTQTPLCSWFPA